LRSGGGEGAAEVAATAAGVGVAAGAFGDHLAEGVFASAAVAADAVLFEFVDALGASLDGSANLAVRSSSADADDHGFVLFGVALIETASQLVEQRSAARVFRKEGFVTSRSCAVSHDIDGKNKSAGEMPALDVLGDFGRGKRI
jgi:hypothetical protein